MSQFQIIIPEQTTNLMLDPSFEYGDPTDYWSTSATGGSSPTVALTADPWVGVYAAEFDFDGASQMILYQGVAVSAASYTLTARVKRAAGGTVSNSYARARFDSATDDWDTIEADKDGWYLCTKTDTATSGTRNFGIVALEDGLIVDAVQLEQKAHATTYCDGDMTGNRGDGYKWNGTAHASTSTRHAQERSGGLIQDIVDDLGATSIKASGLGVPEETHHTEDLSLLPGSLYQGSKVGSRYIDLTLNFKGTSISNLHAKRKLLRQAIKRNRVTPEQPFVFRYTGNSDPLEIDALYAGGMQQGELAKYTEKAGVRLFCPQPYWRKPGNKASALTVQGSLADADCILYRSPLGEWQSISSATNGAILAMALRNDGTVVVVGDFTSIDGVSANRVAIYDPSAGSFSAVGSGANDTVKDVAIGPDGQTIYIIGDFTSPGNGIAYYDTSWQTMGSGASGGDVDRIVIDQSGYIYAIGGFTSMGGVSADGVAYYDSAWNAMGTPDITGKNDIIVGIDNTVYLCGSSSGDIKIQSWNGTSWDDVGNAIFAFTHEMFRLTQSAGGVLYAYLTTASSQLVYRLDGNSWSRIGLVDGDVRCLWHNAGRLYATGLILSVDGIETGSGYIISTGSTWMPGDIIIPSSGDNIVYDIIGDNYGGLYICFGSSGTATVGGITTVDYDGTADSHPTFAATGPGRLYNLINYTTSTAISFDLELLTGETVTLDLDPQRVRFTSSSPTRGNIINKILNGSDVAAWRLQEGENSIGLFIDDNTATAFLIWQELYEAADG